MATLSVTANEQRDLDIIKVLSDMSDDYVKALVAKAKELGGDPGHIMMILERTITDTIISSIRPHQFIDIVDIVAKQIKVNLIKALMLHTQIQNAPDTLQ